MHIKGSIFVVLYICLTLPRLFILVTYGQSEEILLLELDPDPEWNAERERENKTIQQSKETQRFLPEEEVCGTIVVEYEGIDPKFKSTIQLAHKEELLTVIGNKTKQFWLESASMFEGKTRNESCVFLNCGPMIYNKAVGGCETIYQFSANSKDFQLDKFTSLTCTCLDPDCEKLTCNSVQLESDECARLFKEELCQECYDFNKSVKMLRAVKENSTQTSPPFSEYISIGNEIKSAVVNKGCEIWIEELASAFRPVRKGILKPGIFNAFPMLDPELRYQFKCLNIEAESTSTVTTTSATKEMVDRTGTRNYDTIIIIFATIVAVLLLAGGILLVWRKSANVEKEMREKSFSSLELDEFFNGKKVDTSSALAVHKIQVDGQYKTLSDLKHKQPCENTATLLPPARENQQAIEIALSQPYQWKWEIPKQKITKSPTLLGKGEFGEVSTGLLYRSQSGLSDQVVQVAIKEAKRELIRPLLMEIKILSYIGQHPNVVSMLGASVSDLRKGKSNSAWLVLELCRNGSLKSILDGYQRVLEISSPSSEIFEGVTKISSQELPTNKTLYKWAFEIALGMEFLEQKKILHIDLAARNVLLDGDLVAKIGDFGSARKLYSNPEYWKRVNFDGSTSEPLAYKWMALESLQLLVFSPKSDVWSYGVTIWEIFEFGKEPYAQINQYDLLTSSLKSGMRLPQPARTDDHIYSCIRGCWEEDPNARPSFTELQEFFKALMEATDT